MSLEIDLATDRPVALRLLADRDAWPSQPTYYGRSHLPVVIRAGADSAIWFTPDAFRSAVLVSRRLCAAAGPDAVPADAPPPGAVEAFRDRYGEFSATYDLEGWYAPFGGERRRVLAAMLPSRAECEAECPAIPEERRVVRSFDEAREQARRPKVERPEPTPKQPGRGKVATGQGSLF